jgi:hypothetical protein
VVKPEQTAEIPELKGLDNANDPAIEPAPAATESATAGMQDSTAATAAIATRAEGN